ncbi:electron carrier/ protein disulfide oxidoreductase [Anaeramoeba flamelloides]|uniref:Electron carrier/ protein disulfide oxidoreductase n=1 Tax=Anaeramoeba flamelloides TaxID=1746091 RepID=A0AAV7YAI0_9EUKA|nr:electron carrier/ protein disulfide oxidoreductase [Anaeramoeba flamelloides]
MSHKKQEKENPRKKKQKTKSSNSRSRTRKKKQKEKSKLSHSIDEAKSPHKAKKKKKKNSPLKKSHHNKHKNHKKQKKPSNLDDYNYLSRQSQVLKIKLTKLKERSELNMVIRKVKDTKSRYNKAQKEHKLLLQEQDLLEKQIKPIFDEISQQPDRSARGMLIYKKKKKIELIEQEMSSLRLKQDQLLDLRTFERMLQEKQLIYKEQSSQTNELLTELNHLKETKTKLDKEYEEYIRKSNETKEGREKAMFQEKLVNKLKEEYGSIKRKGKKINFDLTNMSQVKNNWFKVVERSHQLKIQIKEKKLENELLIKTIEQNREMIDFDDNESSDVISSKTEGEEQGTLTSGNERLFLEQDTSSIIIKKAPNNNRDKLHLKSNRTKTHRSRTLTYAPKIIYKGKNVNQKTSPKDNLHPQSNSNGKNKNKSDNNNYQIYLFSDDQEKHINEPSNVYYLTTETETENENETETETETQTETQTETETETGTNTEKEKYYPKVISKHSRSNPNFFKKKVSPRNTSKNKLYRANSSYSDSAIKKKRHSISNITPLNISQFNKTEQTNKTVSIDTLEQLLSLPKGIEYFKEFLCRQLNQENIMFFQEAKKLKQGEYSQYQIKKNCTRIYKTFVKPESLFEINIVSEMRKKITNLINEKNFSREMFDEAQKAVFDHMNLNSWQAFTQTNLYKSLINFLKKDPGSLSRIENKKIKLFYQKKNLKALNEEYNPPEKNCKPLQVGEELLVTLINLLYTQYSISKRTINLKSIAKSIPFQRFVQLTSELKNIELNELSENERKCFFLNLFNTLTLHSYIINGIPNNKNSYIKLMDQSRYLIGKYYFSLTQIFHGILRANMDLKHSDKYFKSKKKIINNALLRIDPRIHFARLNSSFDPLIKIYRIDTFNDALNAITSKVINDIIRIEKNKIHIPKYFEVFQDDFGGESIFLDWFSTFINDSVVEKKFKIFNIKFTQKKISTPLVWIDLKRTLARKFLRSSFESSTNFFI